MKSSIENDLDGFKTMEDRVIRKDNAIDTLLMVRNKRIKLSNKQLRKSHHSAGLGILLSYDKAAFETLKNNGLQKLKSDSLKKEITRFYEVQLPRFHEFIDDNYYYYKPKIDEVYKRLNQIGFYEDYFDPGKDSTGYFIRVKYDFDKIHTKEYEEYLLIQARYKKENWMRVDATIRYTQQVLELINKEINSRFKDGL